MARAKGMSEWRLVLKYPVRLAINPLVSTIGWYLPLIFSGSVIVATVLNLPTIGPMLLRSLISQDMFLAGTIVMIYLFLAIIGTLISDISAGMAGSTYSHGVAKPELRIMSTNPDLETGGTSAEQLYDIEDVSVAPFIADEDDPESIYVAPNWKLVWWRFKKHKLAVFSYCHCHHDRHRGYAARLLQHARSSRVRGYRTLHPAAAPAFLR